MTTYALLVGDVIAHIVGRKHTASASIFSYWQEKSASDAVAKLVAQLGLPNRLSQVGVTSDEQIRKIAEMTLTDVLAKYTGLPEFDSIVEILDSVR
ncbi:hypothetical protein TMatcc_002097 [Talaromyces marneffei ATCC 18224]|uniref:Alcohol dehydrogenase iron-type/glycerol dehydrogenase GldA domain-containing protein n=1 Tax=Talaromyces marneffei (strain ATCC 18224 / CBS 334.59 / QM 7333) TaxID=441960 RepID=B6QIP3_TALMQ|nr:uncharacterized protein EYB26_006725 [Talaromyces marneffei]EEA23238.1 hypothetical protein PMAA_098290 [Talaromyces marneffei ATCC 18224]KAE8552086.1 hypothetical protein EYB25_005980 [Talaromyces marneffei]QGA19040.1 hypothetical protein EYB26_006725 [Talaromyces marneffei]